MEVNGDGSLNVLIRGTGRGSSAAAGYFEDTEDAGDEYDYSPAANSQTITSQGGTASAARRTLGAAPGDLGSVAQRARLPVGADRRPARPAARHASTARSRRSSPCARMPVGGDPRRRWTTARRITGCASASRAASVDRCLDRGRALRRGHAAHRPARDAGLGSSRRCRPSTSAGFVDLSDGEDGPGGLQPRPARVRGAARRRQLPVAVTLLRCVGAISRGDMLSRPSHAGIPCETPEAQCHGTTPSSTRSTRTRATGRPSTGRRRSTRRASTCAAGTRPKATCRTRCGPTTTPMSLHGEFVLDLPSRERRAARRAFVPQPGAGVARAQRGQAQRARPLCGRRADRPLLQPDHRAGHRDASHLPAHRAGMGSPTWTSSRRPS